MQSFGTLIFLHFELAIASTFVLLLELAFAEAVHCVCKPSLGGKEYIAKELQLRKQMTFHPHFFRSLFQNPLFNWFLKVN